MISLDQWQRYTPKQQWDAFNVLQNAQAVSAKVSASFAKQTAAEKKARAQQEHIIATQERSAEFLATEVTDDDTSGDGH